MVVLQATVLTSKGSFARGLSRQEFYGLRGSHPQTISLFNHNDSPVAIGLVIDTSGSMRRKHTAVLAAAKAFARNSDPQDELFVVSFNEKVTLGLGSAQPFRPTPASWIEPFRKLSAVDKLHYMMRSKQP